MKKKGDKSYPQKVKTKAVAKYLACGSITEVVEEMGLPYGTIQYWIAQARRNSPEKFEQMRERINSMFETRANFAIDKYMTLLDRKAETALEHQYEIELMIDEIAQDPDISKEKKKDLVSKLSVLKLEKANEIASVIGILRDKRALAAGESTQRAAVEFVLPEGLNQYAD